MASPTLQEKLDKIKSPGLQSQQKVKDLPTYTQSPLWSLELTGLQNSLILEAVEATLKEQKTPQTATSYFAALLALLNQPSNANNTEILTSVVYLLDVVTPFAPQPLLRAKFTQILTVLAPLLQRKDAEAILLRSSIGCLESLLLAQDSSAWELSVSQIGPRMAVFDLLNLSLNPKPKVRKRALDALKHVLKTPPPSPSLDHPASDMCAHTAMKHLENLAEAAARQRKHKNSTDQDPALVHALQLIKAIASSSGGWPSKQIEPLCELLLRIAKSGNEHMTMATFDIFEMIFSGMADEVSSSKLPRLMEIISELQPAPNDTQLVPPWLAILSRGYDVSAQVEPDETFQKLPDLFTMVSKFLESPSQNIRISASECLVSFMATCVPRQVILEPSIYDQKILEKIARQAESLLSVQYQAAWLETFSVLGAMYDSLRWAAYPIMLNITRLIGEIRGNDSFHKKKQADEVIGKAVRSMGPEAVLSVLPLNLTKPVKGQPGRAWMMPILRDYVSNTNLAHFKSEMVPLSQAMFQRVLDHGQAEKTMEVKIFETLVNQVWSILPGYCDLPLDLTEAFDQGFAEILANILYQQVDLRLDVCRALRMLVDSNQAIASIEEEEDDLILQSRVTRAQAKANLEYLGTFAANMLAVLFNVYTQTLPQSRGPILQTINAFLSITPNSELMETFDRVSKLLAAELQQEPPKEKPKGQKQEDKMPSTSNTLMDLVITMSPYLPRESYSALFEIAAVVIAREAEPQLQKKAYKLIPRLAESEIGKLALQERNGELQALLIANSEKVSAPARRERLAAISALIPFIPSTSLHFIPQILSEVVICCKENNERARETAYSLLVQMGNQLETHKGAAVDNSKVSHMPNDAPPVTASIEEYFTMVSAGLAGSTPHMISASITALSRILYEFHEQLSTQTLTDLVETMDLFLTSNNREIVKSVLGFIKICVLRLPQDLMLARMPTLVPNLIVWSHEHKAHFKAKVKHIVERMMRRFGYGVVHDNCPESDRKLVVNIRKTKERTKRKKDSAREGGAEGEEGESGDEEEQQDRKFDNEYDEALYSSDSSDGSDAEGDEGANRNRNKAPRSKREKGGRAYIIEDEDEPLDLLDKRALANISTTKPVRMRQPTKSKAKFDLDGKLILGRDDEGGDAMDVDDASGAGGESGVGAYVAALKGKDAARRMRGGKLKFSNKRSGGGDDDDDDEEMDRDDAMAVKERLNKSPRGGRGRDRPFNGGRGRGGHGHGRGGMSGKGGIAAGRRGLGVEKRRGGFNGGGVGKPRGRR